MTKYEWPKFSKGKRFPEWLKSKTQDEIIQRYIKSLQLLSTIFRIQYAFLIKHNTPCGLNPPSSLTSFLIALAFDYST